MSTPLFLTLLSSYLIGSISGGVIIGKIRKIDIRKMGSKSAGGTNAFRTVGAIFALMVISIDIFKGYFSTIYVPMIFMQQSTLQVEILAGIFSILGHVYPIYFDFKGGKGVATSLGVLLAVFNIKYTLIALSMWTVTLILSGYVGLSSIIAGFSILIINVIDQNEIYYQYVFGLFIALFFIFTHRENIIRMAKGKENQFKKIMLISNFLKK